MEKVRGQCLICEQQVNRNAKDEVKVQFKLDMFFVLRKVVEVSDPLLLKFLEGTTMTSVDLCERCQETVKECREVHEQLSKLQGKWNECKVRIMNSVKHWTWMSQSPEEGHSVALDLQRETRRYVASQVSQEPRRSVMIDSTSKPEINAGGRGHQPSSSTVIFSGEEGGNTPLPMKKEVTTEVRPKPAQQHQKIPRERSHPCPRCPKKYVNPYLLQKHLLAHPKLPNNCGDCGKQFFHKHGLQAHELVHTGENPHECQLCHKRFRHKVNLNRHMKAHLGEKHFKCDICGKAFVQKSELINHRSVHTGEKPWKCNLCPNAYGHQPQLSRHKKIHQANQAHKIF